MVNVTNLLLFISVWVFRLITCVFLLIFSFRKFLHAKGYKDVFPVTVSVFLGNDSHFNAILLMSRDVIMFLNTDDDTVLSAFVLNQIDMRNDPQHSGAIIIEYQLSSTDSVSELSSNDELNPTTIGPLHENHSMIMNVFMDPRHSQPFLNHYKLFKLGY